MCSTRSFGLKYDVTKPLVLTRIRQSRLRWKTCRRNNFTSATTHFVLFQSYFCQCGHRKLASSCSHAVDSGTPVWDVPKFKLLQHILARPGPWRLIVFLDHGTESDRCFWLETWTAEICTVLFASVLGQEDVAVFQEMNTFIPKASASRSKFTSSLDHTRPPHFSVALAVVLTMNARRFQTHPLSGVGSSLNASKDIIAMGVY